MSFAIHGIGTANPPDSVSPKEGLAIARLLAGPDVRTSTWLSSIYTSAGVERRFQVIGGLAMRDALDGTTHTNSPFLPSSENDGIGPSTGERMKRYAAEAGPMALLASAKALAESEFESDTITHLVTVSCTGFVAPGIDLALITGLGLRPTVQRTHVGFMGCHGALNGLRVANAFATRGSPRARIALCGGTVQPALLLRQRRGQARGERDLRGRRRGRGRRSDWPSQHGPWSLRASGSCLIPDSADDMRWTVGDHGFEMTLSRRVPGLIATTPSAVARIVASRQRAVTGGGAVVGRPPRRAEDRFGGGGIAGTSRRMHSQPRAACSPITAICRARRCCSCSIGFASKTRRDRALRSASAPASWRKRRSS